MQRAVLGVERIMAEQSACLKNARLAQLPVPEVARHRHSPPVPQEYLEALRQPVELGIGAVHEICPSEPIRTRFAFLDLLRLNGNYTSRLVDIGIGDGRIAAE
jgi:hypothetical protein